MFEKRAIKIYIFSININLTQYLIRLFRIEIHWNNSCSNLKIPSKVLKEWVKDSFANSIYSCMQREEEPSNMKTAHLLKILIFNLILLTVIRRIQFKFRQIQFQNDWYFFEALISLNIMLNKFATSNAQMCLVLNQTSIVEALLCKEVMWRSKSLIHP